MKKIFTLLCLIAIIGCKSKKSTSKKEEVKTIKVEQLAIADVDESQIDKAYELGKRILMTCNTSKFKPFTESEATAKVIQNITQEKLTKTCLKFRLKYGDFKDIKLVEVYKIKADKSTVFRYKALYQKQIAHKELQVTLNEENKVSSIKSLDWNDTFQYK